MTTEFLGYPVPVAYSVGLEVNSTWFTVTYDGSTYVALANAIPFTTTADFDASKWQLTQGVRASDLSGDDGAGFIGWIQEGEGALAQTVSSALRRTITPEDYGAHGDGVADDTSAIKKALAAWYTNPTARFIANGYYAISTTIDIYSPKTGAKIYFNRITVHPSFNNSSSFIFSRPALVRLIPNPVDSSATWGAQFHLGEGVGLGSGYDYGSYVCSCIENAGWQQAGISWGLIQGFVAAVNVTASLATVPTINYTGYMTRGNIFAILGPQSEGANMQEGSIFNLQWVASNVFAGLLMGEGSAYLRLRGGSFDFNGRAVVALKVADAASAALGVFGGVVVQGSITDGVCIGSWYRVSTREYYILVADDRDTTANSSNSYVSPTRFNGEAPIEINGGGSITVTGIFTAAENNAGTQEDLVRWYWDIVGCFPVSYPYSRWTVDVDFCAGLAMSGPLFYYDLSAKYTHNGRRFRMSLPGGAEIYSGITAGNVTFGSADYVTQYSFPNVFITTNGVYTNRSTSVWKHNGGGTTTTTEGASSLTPFTAASLGMGQIAGRISGSSSQIDTVGMWRATGYGRKLDGALVCGEWIIVSDGANYDVKEVFNDSPINLASGEVPVMTGSLDSSYVAAGASWQWRMTVTRILVY